jgi:hypothetical protein
MPATSRLEQLLAEVQARILVALPACSFRFGSAFVASHEDAPPRIVWVRGDDAFAPARVVGGNPRALLTRTSVVVAHCWAQATADLTRDAATEQLVDVLAWALRQVLGADGLPTAAEWIDPPAAQDSSLACLVAFSVQLPVVEPSAAPTVVVTAAAPDASDAVAGDGLLDCGSSS